MVRIVKDLDIDLSGRDVLLVEDIVDSGLTLRYLRTQPRGPQPGQPRGVRPARCGRARQTGARPAATSGFEIPPDFVIGYGLDVAERYRNLPYICAYNEELPE